MLFKFKEKYTKKDIENNKCLAIVSYLFAPVVYYSKAKKNSKWLRQGKWGR